MQYQDLKSAAHSEFHLLVEQAGKWLDTGESFDSLADGHAFVRAELDPALTWRLASTAERGALAAAGRLVSE